MNSDLKLRFLKVLANVPVRLLDKLLAFPEKPQNVQTRMLLRAYKRLAQAYQLDCHNGAFGASPDGNFERLLRVSMKLLANVSENDRYYRAWLGLSFLLAKEETERLTLPQLKSAVKTQGLMDLDFAPESCFEDLREMGLADYLPNLTRTK